MNDPRMAEITAVQAKYADHLMTYPNVVGIGIGYQQQQGKTTDVLCLVVMVDEKRPLSQLSPTDVLPTQLDGVPIDVQATGSFAV